MQTLDSALTTAQKISSKPAPKITLTHGATEYVLEADRIKSFKHYFDPDHVYAKEAEFDNSDGFFTELDLKGYTAVISHGLLTKAGKKYADTSLMTVTWQQLNSAPGHLSCLLTMLGIPDMMALDEASADYIPAESDTKSVKDLLREIAGDTGVTMMACFNHCAKYDIEWKVGYDALADTHMPKDSFRVYTGGSRWAAFKRLLERTSNVARFSSTGKIYILAATTTGTTYDYEYSLDSGHPFLSKAYRKALVLPNYIVVSSQQDDSPFYSGYAKDDESYALLPKRAYYTARLQVGEADTISAAMLKRAQLNSEIGSAEVPINCGAELFDYIKVTDKREGDSRTGNVGSISISYNASKQDYSMRFSLGDPPVNQYIKELYQSLKTLSDLKDLELDRLRVKQLYVDEFISLDDIQEGINYKRVLSTQISAGKILLSDACEYTAGFDPSSKSRTFTTTPTTPYDVGDTWNSASTVRVCTTARATGAYQATDWLEITQDAIANGMTFSRVQTAALTPAGLILLDQVAVGTYGLVLSTDISAGHIKLSECSGSLDDIDNGTTYAKLQTTDISSGHIKLTSYVSVSGEWYDNQGVLMNSAFGIRLYGGQVALSTHPTYADAVANTNIQCYVGTDGKLYAGAGAVELSADGLVINGQYILFKSGGVTKGTIYGATGYFYVSGLVPLALVGTPNIIANSPLGFGADCYFDLPQRTSHPTGAEGRMYYNTSDHNVYIYANGSWQTAHNY